MTNIILYSIFFFSSVVFYRFLALLLLNKTKRYIIKAMKITTFWIYLAILSGSTYLIRTIPFVAVKNKIKNKFIQSFLYYIPYAVLAAMTIPAIFYATNYILSAVAGLVVAILFALKSKSLTTVAIAACITVFIVELFI